MKKLKFRFGGFLIFNKRLCSFIFSILLAGLLLLLPQLIRAQTGCSPSNELNFANPTTIGSQKTVDVVWNNPPASLAGMNFSVQLSPSVSVQLDPSTFQSVNPLFPGSIYQVSGSPLSLTFSGFDNNNPVDLSDYVDESVTLFTIKFSGDPNQCYQLSFVPISYLISTGVPNYTGCPSLNAGSSIQICFQGVTINGNIQTDPPFICDNTINHGVDNVAIDVTENGSSVCTDLTNSTGDYSCTVVSGGNYQVRPTKADNPACGVSTFDMVILQKHIFATDCLDFPRELFAADANGNGLAATADLAVMQLVTLGNISSAISLGFRSWDFVPVAQYAAVPDPLPSCISIVPSFNPYIDYPNNPLPEFIGVKIGDVNGSCTACSGASKRSTKEEKPLTVQKLEVSPLELQKGETGYLKLYSGNITDLNLLQIGLQLAPEYFEVLGLKSALEESGSFVSYLPKKQAGLVKFNWLSLTTDVHSISGNTPVAVIEVRAKQDLPGLEDLLWLEGENVFYSEQSLDAVGLELPWDNKTLQEDLLRVYPSPFSGELVFELDLRQEGKVQLTLLDNLGREIRRLDTSLEKGTQTLTFSNLGELPAGVYYYRMRVAGATRSGKIVKQ